MLYFEIIDGKPENKPAFIFREQVMTYGELSAKVSKWANFLQAQGVRHGDRIGLLSKNCPAFVVAYLAIIKAGGVVVPFNFQLAPLEVAYIVKDSSMKFLIDREKLPLDDALKATGITEELHQYTFEEMDAAVAHVFVNYPIKEKDNCTIIYTSGTTGKPKGAMLSHKNLVSNAYGFTEVVATYPTDITLCVLPMYHCFAWTVSVSGQLLFGATIVVQETYIFKDTMQLIAKHNVNTFYGVPTMMQLFLKGATSEELQSVRFFVSGGAPLPQVLAKSFKEKFGKFVQEGYGLSEASPVVSVNKPDKIKIGSIGPALPNLKVAILGADGQELPVGEVGELCVQGENVMLGYLNLPEETAHTLRGGWLHTGDLAYRDDEDYLFIVDRLKDMIISSGENVYPREVEEELYAHPGIAEAAVIGIPDKLRGQAICAYMVLKEGAELTKRDVRKFLLERIAAYKVPREFFFCPQLPKNSTGKILKNALREQALVDMVHRKR